MSATLVSKILTGAMIAHAIDRLKTMPPEDRAKMKAAQRASYIRGMTTPCQHGVLDFEQCGDCRSLTPTTSPEGPQEPAAALLSPQQREKGS